MEYARWAPYYEGILETFGFDRAQDERARDVLDALLASRPLMPSAALARLLRGTDVSVFGPALPSRGKDLLGSSGPRIVADGAVRAFTSLGARADVIVTDLDGDVELQLALNRAGVLVVIHAHGDNIHSLERFVPRFEGPVIATCQCEPTPRVLNFGGFTDGDRACFLAEHFGAAALTLVGFDFDVAAQKPGVDPVMKQKKLQYAHGLLGALSIPVREAPAARVSG